MRESTASRRGGRAGRTLAVLVPLLVLLVATSCRRSADPPVVVVFHTPATSVAIEPYLEDLREELDGEVDLHFARLPPRLETVVEQAREMLRAHEPHVVVLHGASRDVVALAPLLAEERIPHIVTTATSKELAGMTRYTHRLVPSDTVQGRVLARFAVERLGVQRPAVLYRRDDYGASITEGLVRELRLRGVRDIMLLPYDDGSDWDLLVEGVAALHRPDGLFLAAYGPNARQLVPRMRERIPDVPVLGTDGVVSSAGPSGPEGWRGHLTGVYMATFWMPDPSNPRERELMARYRAMGGVRGSHFFFLLDDGITAARAAVAEGADRSSVQRYLVELGDRRPPLPGLTGPIHFRAGRAPMVRIARLGPDQPEPVDPPGARKP